LAFDSDLHISVIVILVNIMVRC